MNKKKLTNEIFLYQLKEEVMRNSLKEVNVLSNMEVEIVCNA